MVLKRKDKKHAERNALFKATSQVCSEWTLNIIYIFTLLFLNIKESLQEALLVSLTSLRHLGHKFL